MFKRIYRIRHHYDIGDRSVYVESDYEENTKINQAWFGWKAVVLRLLGVNLQDRAVAFGIPTKLSGTE